MCAFGAYVCDCVCVRSVFPSDPIAFPIDVCMYASNFVCVHAPGLLLFYARSFFSRDSVLYDSLHFPLYFIYSPNLLFVRYLALMVAWLLVYAFVDFNTKADRLIRIFTG